jgi:Lrp/AsnC family transcriptional regulator, leucine-responsive regulatory protein
MTHPDSTAPGSGSTLWRMSQEATKLLDGVGWKILTLLQEQGRISFSDLGRSVGLSAPAVAERVRRMEEAGIITGYHAAIDPTLVGRPLRASLRLSGVSDRWHEVNALLQSMPEVIEAQRVTGGDSYHLKVVVASMQQLEAVINRLLPYALVTTALVLSTPVGRRTIGPDGAPPTLPQGEAELKL